MAGRCFVPPGSTLTRGNCPACVGIEAFPGCGAAG